MQEKSLFLAIFLIGMSLMSEVTRLRRVMSVLPKLCALRQKTPIGTFGKGIGWGIALRYKHGWRERAIHLHIDTWRDFRVGK